MFELMNLYEFLCQQNLHSLTANVYISALAALSVPICLLFVSK